MASEKRYVPIFAVRAAKGILLKGPAFLQPNDRLFIHFDLFGISSKIGENIRWHLVKVGDKTSTTVQFLNVCSVYEEISHPADDIIRIKEHIPNTFNFILHLDRPSDAFFYSFHDKVGKPDLDFSGKRVELQGCQLEGDTCRVKAGSSSKECLSIYDIENNKIYCQPYNESYQNEDKSNLKVEEVYSFYPDGLPSMGIMEMKGGAFVTPITYQIRYL